MAFFLLRSERAKTRRRLNGRRHCRWRGRSSKSARVSPAYEKEYVGSRRRRRRAADRATISCAPRRIAPYALGAIRVLVPGGSLLPDAPACATSPAVELASQASVQELGPHA
jgi:hypothetical protein